MSSECTVIIDGQRITRAELSRVSASWLVAPGARVRLSGTSRWRDRHRRTRGRVRTRANKVVAGARCSLLRIRSQAPQQIASTYLFHQVEGLAVATPW